MSGSSSSNEIVSPGLLVGSIGARPLYAAMACLGNTVAASSSSGSSARVDGEDGVLCDCPHASKGMPLSYTVRLDYFANLDCDLCDAINGDFVLEYIGYDVSSDSCIFRNVRDPVVLCDDFSTVFQLQIQVFSTSVIFTVDSSTFSALWDGPKQLWSEFFLFLNTNNQTACSVPYLIRVRADYDVPVGTCGPTGLITMGMIVGEQDGKVIYAGGNCKTGVSGSSSASAITAGIPVDTYHLARLIGFDDQGSSVSASVAGAKALYAIHCCSGSATSVSRSASSFRSSSASQSRSSSSSASLSASPSPSSASPSSSGALVSSSASRSLSSSSAAISCCTGTAPTQIFATFGGCLSSLGTVTLNGPTTWAQTFFGCGGGMTMTLSCSGGVWTFNSTGSVRFLTLVTVTSCSPFAGSVTSGTILTGGTCCAGGQAVVVTFTG